MEREDDGEKEEYFFKVAGKLLRRGRGNILGLSVERRSPAGCTPGFEVLCRFSPAHEPPPRSDSLYPAIHLCCNLTSKGEDAMWARPTVRGVNPNAVTGRERGEATPAPVVINLQT